MQNQLASPKKYKLNSNMKNQIIHLLLLTLCATTSPAQDIVIFKNGDTLTGEILKQNDTHIHFKSKSIGLINLQANDIAEIKIEVGKIGKITIPSKAITKPEPKRVTQTPPQTKAPPPQTTKKKKNQWSSQAGLAIAMRESNTLRRSGSTLVEKNEEFESYRIYGNVKWKGEKNDLKWNWIYRYSRSDLRKNDDYLNLTQNYHHNFTDTYFTTAKTIYQKDYRRGIDSEYLQTAELGIKWFNSQKFKISTSAGGGYHQYARAQNNYSSAEGKFILDESIRWQIIHSLTLFQKYTHLGGLKKYHFVFTSGLENKLVQNLFLRLEYRLDRDTDVDYDDRSYYDKALLTSLLYKF